MTYSETISWLFQQFPSYQNLGAKAYKPDLYNVEKLCSIFNNPQKDLKTIHVAGTNGKGSTCSYISSFLTEQNYKVGLFTSPHLQRFTERIRINGIEVSEDFVVDFVDTLKTEKLDYEPSFFEISFVMSLVYFKKEKVDFAVIETGLGGRLDATNIVEPILSVITNIGLEHTNFLGTTLEEIAGEKGGIIKEFTPVVIGSNHPKTSPVFNTIATHKNAELCFANRNIDYPKTLLANYQKENFATAVESLRIILKDDFSTHEEITEQFSSALSNLYKNTGLRARMQVTSTHPTTIFDAAHNSDGITALLSTFRGKEEHLKIVYGSSNDKDLNEIFKLFPKKASFHFTTFKNERSANIESLKEFSAKNELKSRFFSDAKTALSEFQSSASQEDTILCFGSFFLLDDLY